MKYQQHPLSAAFPPMVAAELQELRDSIEVIGVQNPITLHDGMVIDGWHRYTAASDLGMDCPAVELSASIDPRDFVLAQNKARRHITVAQMAMAANAVYQWRAAGRPAINSAGPAELTQSDIAERTGVSVRSLRQASKVEKEGAPEVIAAVKSGAVGLEKAAAIAQLPESQQAEALAAPATPRRVAAPAPAPSASPAPKAPASRASAAADVAEMETQIAVLTAQRDEFRQQLSEAWADLAAASKVMEADDRLSAALRDAQEQRALCRGLQARLDNLVNEVGEAKRQASYWKRKAGQPA